MKRLIFALYMAVLIVSFPPLVRASKFAAFPEKLPAFSLPDPHGKRYTAADFSKDHLIMVVTAPTHKNKEAQEGWAKYLRYSRETDEVTLIFIEDLVPSRFKETAKKRLRAESEPGREPILLIDPRGEVREKLRAPAGKTVVLVYDRQGHLRHVEAAQPSKQGATAIWKSLGIVQSSRS